MHLQGENPLSALLLGIGDQLRPPAEAVELVPTDRVDGATCLVTGANSGLGKAVAVELARRGGRLVMLCRSGIPEAGEEVRRLSGNDAVEMMRIDLADLRSVRSVADELARRGRPVDVVVANAGVMPRSARATAQGFELMFGVNYLGHALLIRRLLADGVVANRALAADPSRAEQDDEPTGRRPRIVIVSSQLHRSARPIDFQRFGGYVDYGIATGIRQYAHTKLLLCTLAQELARRLAPNRPVEVAVHSLCPGGVATNIAREVPSWLRPTAEEVMRRTLASPERAALPVVYLACADAMEGQTGSYLHMAMPKPPAPAALDRAAGRALWEATGALLEPFERD